MLLIGFFFLLRPGEYAHTSNPESCPFRLCDVHLMHGVTRLDPFHAAEITLRSATHVALEFTNQKNGVRGELVGLGRSGHPHFSTPTMTETVLTPLQPALSHHNCAILSQPLEHSGALARAISASGPSAPQAPWPSCARRSTQTKFACLEGGALTKCCATFTCRPFPLLPHWRHRCSNMAILPSFPTILSTLVGY